MGGFPRFLASFVFALSATTLSIRGIDVGILSIQWMPARAMRLPFELCLVTISTPPILIRCNRFQVRWIDAPSISAKVINFLVGWDLVEQKKDRSMGFFVPIPAVAVFIETGCPIPAPSLLVDGNLLSQAHR
jgi:hypothetical protein